MPRAARCLPLILLLLPSCGGGGGGSNGGGNGLPPGPGTFSVSPIEVAAITNLEPLGAMNPPGHTIPTDHVYFYYVPINIGPVAAAKCPG
jgi:hypothetical protein